MVICLERGADLHMAQLMPLPLTVSCFSKIRFGFTILVPAHPGSLGKRAVKRVCVCVCVCDDTSEAGGRRTAGRRRLGRRPRRVAEAVPAQLSAHQLRVVLGGGGREAGGAGDGRAAAPSPAAARRAVSQSPGRVGATGDRRGTFAAAPVDSHVAQVRLLRRRSHRRRCIDTHIRRQSKYNIKS